MLSKLFLGMSLVGAEWVLYVLVFLSLISVALIIERWSLFRGLTKGSDDFRNSLSQAVAQGDSAKALKLAQERKKSLKGGELDLDAGVAIALLDPATSSKSFESLNELGASAILQRKLAWERNLSVLATIGSNAPFIGLFGTVLGIIQAFHDLSREASGSGAQLVIGGVSDALIATAVGILVAIPAVVAYNLFQRRVKAASQMAEALKSHIIGHTVRK